MTHTNTQNIATEPFLFPKAALSDLAMPVEKVLDTLDAKVYDALQYAGITCLAELLLNAKKNLLEIRQEQQGLTPEDINSINKILQEKYGTCLPRQSVELKKYGLLFERNDNTVHFQSVIQMNWFSQNTGDFNNLEEAREFVDTILNNDCLDREKSIQQLIKDQNCAHTKNNTPSYHTHPQLPKPEELPSLTAPHMAQQLLAFTTDENGNRVCTSRSSVGKKWLEALEEAANEYVKQSPMHFSAEPSAHDTPSSQGSTAPEIEPR